MKRITVEIRNDDDRDVVAARRAARKMASDVGLRTADQTRLATAVSELTRNVIQHAGNGTCTVIDASDDKTLRVQVKVEDEGPGIPDIDQALEDGLGSMGGHGEGLPSVRRIVHRFEIDSRPGKTLVTIEISRRRL